MSFLFPKPTTSGTEASTLGLEPDWLSTHQEAIPAPLFGGWARLGSKWLCQPMRERSTPIKQDMGKAGTQTSGNNWYGDIAAEYCCGPVDVLEKLYYKGKAVWETRIDRDDQLYEDLQILNYADARLHWGTSEQMPSSFVLNALDGGYSEITREQYPQEFEKYVDGGDVALSGMVPVAASPRTHPAYRNLFYIEWKNLFYGANQKTTPDLEALLGRSPRPFGISLPEELTEEGVNPITFIAELITNPFFGLGWSADIFRTDNWQEVAGKIQERADDLYMSPLFTQGTSVRAAIGQILGQIDGFCVPKQGKLEVGFFEHDGEVPNLPELSHHDKFGSAKIKSPGWTKTVTEVHAEYRDKARDMMQTYEPGVSSYSKRNLSANQPETESTFFVTRRQSKQYAEERAVTKSFAEESGTHPFRLNRAANFDGSKIMPGDRFLLNDNDELLKMVVRCTRRTESRKDGRATLTWTRERGLFAMKYSKPGDKSKAEIDPVVPIVNARVLELSQELTESVRTSAVILAERPASDVEFFNIWLSESGQTYDHVYRQQSWAVKGQLRRSVTWQNPSTIPTANGSQSGRVGGIAEEKDEAVDLSFSAVGYDILKLQPQSNQEKVDNTLILVCGDELFSLGKVVAEGNGNYRAEMAYRHRLGSVGQSHNVGAECWIVTRDDLLNNAMYHRSFAEGDHRYFKLQSARTGVSCPFADSLVLEHVFEERETALPIITFYPLDEPIVTGQEIHLEGNIEDQNEDIIQWSLSILSENGETNVGGASVVPTGLVEFDVAHTFLKPGNYAIKITATDFENQLLGVAEYRWPEVGSFTVTGEDLSAAANSGKLSDVEKGLELVKKHEAELRETSEKIVETLEAQARDFLAQVEKVEGELGHKINNVEKAWIEDSKAIALSLKQLATVGNRNGSAISSMKKTISDNENTMAELNDTLVSTSEGMWKTIKSNATAVSDMRTEIERIGIDYKTVSRKLDELRVEHDSVYRKQKATASLLDTQIARIDDTREGLSTQVTDLKELTAEIGDDRAKVKSLSDVFIKDGEVVAFASMEIDVNGKFIGWKMIGGKSPNGKEYGELELYAPKLFINLDGERFQMQKQIGLVAFGNTNKLVEGHPGAEILQYNIAGFIKADGTSFKGEPQDIKWY